MSLASFTKPMKKTRCKVLRHNTRKRKTKKIKRIDDVTLFILSNYALHCRFISFMSDDWVVFRVIEK